MELLDRAAVSQRIGTENYLGGWVDPRAGSLHPLSYARGPAKAAMGQGAMIHGHSRVTGLQRQRQGWHLSTALGRHLAAKLSGATQDFPFPITPLRRIPFHGLQRLYLAAGITYCRLLGALP
ncbi:FAD-dependent oxidoreductase [Pseudomonas sp. LB3P14]